MVEVVSFSTLSPLKMAPVTFHRHLVEYCDIPMGVLNVHNLELSLSNFICQNPWLASSTENTLAFGMFDKTSSAVSSG